MSKTEQRRVQPETVWMELSAITVFLAARNAEGTAQARVRNSFFAGEPWRHGA